MNTQYIQKDDVVTYYHKDFTMTIFRHLDGHTIEWSDGTKKCWFDGKQYSEQQFLELTKPKKLTVTMDQIAAKFGVSADSLKIVK